MICKHNFLLNPASNHSKIVKMLLPLNFVLFSVLNAQFLLVFIVDSFGATEVQQHIFDENTVQTICNLFGEEKCPYDDYCYINGTLDQSCFGCPSGGKKTICDKYFRSFNSVAQNSAQSRSDENNRVLDLIPSEQPFCQKRNGRFKARLSYYS